MNVTVWQALAVALGIGVAYLWYVIAAFCFASDELHQGEESA